MELAYIPSSLQSEDTAISSIKYAAACALTCYICIIFVIFIYNNKKQYESIMDINSAKILMYHLRVFIILEVLSLSWLLVNTMLIGCPLPIDYAWVIYKGFSWIYNFPRPVSGIFLIGIGINSDIHVLIRGISVSGCILQILSDSISAIETISYYHQIKTNHAVSQLYSTSGLFFYFARDISSIFLTCVILLLLTHLSIILGVSISPRYSYNELVGGDLDRCGVMHRERSKRGHVYV
jgi:hypothetical protein